MVCVTCRRTKRHTHSIRFKFGEYAGSHSMHNRLLFSAKKGQSSF